MTKWWIGNSDTDPLEGEAMNVKKGDRVEVTGIQPNNPAPLPVGLQGTVEEVVPPMYGMEGQVWVDWDADEQGHKRTLILLSSDPFRVVT